MKEEELSDYVQEHIYDIINGDIEIWAIRPTYDYEDGAPSFYFIRMFWFTPSQKYDLAIWYIINFYVTVVGFTIELLLILAMISNMMKKNSEFRNYYYLQTFIIILFDMIRFFIPADYKFSPSFFFTRKVANTLRGIHVFYGFLMCIFVPISQMALTMNRLTALIFPIIHKKVTLKYF